VAAKWTADLLDVLMLRYNIGHRGVESDVFPSLKGDKRCDPGIVAFNATHEGQRFFNVAPSWYSKQWPTPSHGDCYRFALSNPFVDVVLAGPKNRAEVAAAVAAIEQGPLSEDELLFMRQYGAAHHRGMQAAGSHPAQRLSSAVGAEP